MRDTPLEDGNEDNVAPPTSEDDTVPLDGSFDILDDQEAQEAQYYGSSLPGSFETERNTRASSIDEFGSLSTAGMFVCFFQLLCCLGHAHPSKVACGCSIEKLL